MQGGGAKGKSLEGATVPQVTGAGPLAVVQREGLFGEADAFSVLKS